MLSYVCSVLLCYFCLFIIFLFIFFFFFFFFSSRRLHTRCLSDWSLDVCSSDLIDSAAINARNAKGAARSITLCTCANPSTPRTRQITTATTAIPRSHGRYAARRVDTTAAKPRSEERRVGKEEGESEHEGARTRR